MSSHLGAARRSGQARQPVSARTGAHHQIATLVTPPHAHRRDSPTAAWPVPARQPENGAAAPSAPDAWAVHLPERHHRAPARTSTVRRCLGGSGTRARMVLWHDRQWQDDEQDGKPTRLGIACERQTVHVADVMWRSPGDDGWVQRMPGHGQGPVTYWIFVGLFIGNAWVLVPLALEGVGRGAARRGYPQSTAPALLSGGSVGCSPPPRSSSSQSASPVGAARTYAHEEDWQRQAAALIAGPAASSWSPATPRPRGSLDLPLSTAPWWRKMRISASFARSDRASRAHPAEYAERRQVGDSQ
jgi:hypothetical protein